MTGAFAPIYLEAPERPTVAKASPGALKVLVSRL
jgi:hypothetical protein